MRLYGRFLYSYIDSYRITTDAAETVKYRNVQSTRTQLGGRYIFHASDSVDFFVDAAWEYQADGRVRSTLDGIPPSPYAPKAIWASAGWA